MTTMEVTGASDPAQQLAAIRVLPHPTPSPETEMVFFDTPATPLFRSEALSGSLPTRLVKGLGSISCPHSRLVQLEMDAQPRVRHIQEVELDGVMHYARVTEPESGSVAPGDTLSTVVLFHGLTEMIDGGTGKDLHDDLAPYFHDKRLISIATDGVGRYCQSLGWRKGWNKDFDTMAINRHRLINALGGDGPVTLISVSMGTVITNRLLSYNRSLPEHRDADPDEAHDRRLEIDAVIEHSHALVPKSNVARDMVARFLPHIVRDTRRVGKKVPEKLHRAIPVALAYKRSLPALTGNVKNLLKGSSWADVYANAAAYQTGIISGERDPLRQPELCLKLASLLPNTVKLNMKTESGHAACLDSQEAARDIADMYDLLTGK